MTQTIQLVREYNKLAISLPNKVWSPRFAHPRMEVVGNRVHLFYQVMHDKQFVPIKEHVAVADIPNEMQRLKRRAERKK